MSLTRLAGRRYWLDLDDSSSEEIDRPRKDLFRVIKSSSVFRYESPKLIDLNPKEKFGEEFQTNFPDVIVQTQTIDERCSDKSVVLPFQNETFHIVYAGSRVGAGIVDSYNFDGEEFKTDGYSIAQESFRVLRQGGIFIFEYQTSSIDSGTSETLDNLRRIGFKALIHLQTTIWTGGFCAYEAGHLYAALKGEPPKQSRLKKYLVFSEKIAWFKEYDYFFTPTKTKFPGMPR